MEIVVLVGLPGSGKSTWVKENLYDTHVRINLDMLNTRNKETELIGKCLKIKQSMVIDNTNITREERKKYIDYANIYNIPIKCVWINRDVKSCISQNRTRDKVVPNIAIYTKNKKFEEPTLEEGFSDIQIIDDSKDCGQFKGKQKILCLDFDGVINSYTTGWNESKGGATYIPDPPVIGAFEFINEAFNHFDVHVYSSRSSHKGGIEAMQTWFVSNGFENINRILFPKSKPPATVAIDDRVLTFTGNWPSMDVLRKFKPWNKVKV